MTRLLKEFGTGSGGSSSWIWQRITGLVLVITLFIHYLFLHFLNHGMVSYSEVTSRLVMPIWKAIDLVFLTAVLFHAVTGVIMSIHDYIHRPVLRVVLVSITWVVAIVLLLVGAATVISIQPY